MIPGDSHTQDFSIKMNEVNKIFANFPAILEKTESDGTLSLIHRTILNVFVSETHYAVQGSLKRTKETEQRQKCNRAKRTIGNKPPYL